jgi:hypothetical protein
MLKNKELQLETSDWAHLLHFYKHFPDLINFWKIDSAKLAQQRNKNIYLKIHLARIIA